MAIKKGDRFVHPHMLNLEWTPGPGQKLAKDAPHAVMEVTKVAGRCVYFGYAGSGSGGFVTTQEALKNVLRAYLVEK